MLALLVHEFSHCGISVKVLKSKLEQSQRNQNRQQEKRNPVFYCIKKLLFQNKRSLPRFGARQNRKIERLDRQLLSKPFSKFPQVLHLVSEVLRGPYELPFFNKGFLVGFQGLFQKKTLNSKKIEKCFFRLKKKLK